MLVFVMGLSAFFGQMAHAALGEAFDVTGTSGFSAAVGTDHHDHLHGHSHSHDDEDWLEEFAEPHKHDHNPLDHSHDIPAIPGQLAGARIIVPTSAYQAFPKPFTGKTSFDIDRPPRS